MNTKAKAALAVILLFGAVHLGLGLLLSSASGQAIDATVPATGADVLSSPIRTNFSAIKSRVETLEGKFPVAATNAVPRFTNTSGAMGSGFCYQITGASNYFSCLGDVTIAGQAGLTSALTSVAGSSSQRSATFARSDEAIMCAIDNDGTTINGRGSTPALSVTQYGGGDIVHLLDDDGTGLILYNGGELEMAAATSNPAFTATQKAAGAVFRAVTQTTGDDPTLLYRQGRVATTDATETTIVTIDTSSNRATYIKAVIVARVTGGAGGHTGQVAAYEFHSAFSNVSGTVTERGTPIEEITIEDTDLAAFAVDIDVDGTSLDVNVTGAANENVTWHATVEYMSLGS